MTRRNYPLTALRAFEAAARHLSFAEAANELHGVEHFPFNASECQNGYIYRSNDKYTK